MVSLFRPVIINVKKNLNEMNCPIVDGQFIVVIDANELYLDIGGERVKISQNIYIQENTPEAPKNGDIWLQIEE